MTSAPAVQAERRRLWEVTRYWMHRLLMMEIWGYVSIFRFVFRRPRVPRGAEAFSYSQLVLPLLIVFLVVSAIELVVVDVLVRRWASLRIALLALGIWGLVWMLGLLFGFLTRPHAVGPEGLRLRSGAELDIPLTWDQVEAVTRRRGAKQGKQPQLTTDEHGRGVLQLHVQDEMNVRIALRRPVSVRLARGEATVSRIDLFVDDPEAFVRSAGRRLAEDRARAEHR